MFRLSLTLLFLSIICACSVTPKYHDTYSRASDPGNVRLSAEKLRIFKESLGSSISKPAPYELLDEHLQHGDSRAAIVMKTNPYLLIAAYSDEMDGVAMLRFDNKFIDSYNLKEGSRLLTINTYQSRIAGNVAKDLYIGPKELGRYSNFYPLIAEFLSDDMDRISRRKNKINEAEWSRTYILGKEYIEKNSYRARNGNPYFSMIPAD